MVKIYIFAGIVAVIVIILKSPWLKGWAGELQINLMTKFFLNKDAYHLIKNVTIPIDVNNGFKSLFLTCPTPRYS